MKRHGCRPAKPKGRPLVQAKMAREVSLTLAQLREAAAAMKEGYRKSIPLDEWVSGPRDLFSEEVDP